MSGASVVSGRVLRFCLAIASALSLTACAARDPLVSSSNAAPAGSWRIERQVDRVTGAPLASAFLTSRSSANSAVAFAQPATLQLLCFKAQPLVRLAFQFRVGSNRNSTLGYRFDDKPGREADARFLQDFRTVVIEDKAEVARFVGELAASNVLYVRIRSLNVGRSSAEFRLDGAPAAIEAAFAGCPPTPEPARRRRAHAGARPAT
jgi:hypothetical protein